MFTFHCTLIALYFGRSCSHLPHELFVFWNPCTCPRECLKSASGLSSCHDLRCRRTVGVIWAFVLLTQPAHCLTSCHSPTPALLLPLALPLWRGRWSRRFQAPTGLHIKLKRVWLQPTPLYASCLWAVPPTSACIGAESERTGAGPGWWTNTLVTQLNGGMMHEIASSTELMGTSPSMAAWSIYIPKHTVSGCASTSTAQPVCCPAYHRVNELKNLFRIVRGSDFHACSVEHGLAWLHTHIWCRYQNVFLSPSLH